MSSSRPAPVPSTRRAARAASRTLRPSLSPTRYGMDTGRAEPLVVGRCDHVAGANEIADVREERCGMGFFDGAQMSASPVVPCAHVTIGRPSAGFLPVGATTTPDTTMSRPSTAVEWYRTTPRVGPVGCVDAHGADQRSRLRLRQRVGHRVEVGLAHPAPRLRTRGRAIAPVSATQVASDTTTTDGSAHPVMLPRADLAGSSASASTSATSSTRWNVISSRDRVRAGRRGPGRCASGRITVGEPGPLGREHLLLDAADGQHTALERDLARHPDLGSHRRGRSAGSRAPSSS